MDKYVKIASDMYSSQGMCCSEAVTSALAEAFELTDKEALLRASAGFCGGMGCGETCGVVSACALIIGAVQGVKGDPSRKASKTSREMVDEFRREFGDVRCSDLLKDYTKGTSEQKKSCGNFVEKGVKITLNILQR